MSEVKHTPGPWVARRANEYETLNPMKCQTIDGRGWGAFVLIATDMESQSDTEEGVANARLIAAAPDLLEALKMAQLWLDIDGRFDMQGINAAIAKATGSAK